MFYRFRRWLLYIIMIWIILQLQCLGCCLRPVISKVEIFDRAQLTVIGSSTWLELPALMKVLGNILLLWSYVSLFVFQAGRRIPWWPCCCWPPFFYQQIYFVSSCPSHRQSSLVVWKNEMYFKPFIFTIPSGWFETFLRNYLTYLI